MLNFARLRLVLMKDGRLVRTQVYTHQGACLVGDPTAYIMLGGELVWVRPGESVSFIEA
jgi:hypothetical protein